MNQILDSIIQTNNNNKLKIILGDKMNETSYYSELNNRKLTNTYM